MSKKPRTYKENKEKEIEKLKTELNKFEEFQTIKDFNILVNINLLKYKFFCKIKIN